MHHDQPSREDESTVVTLRSVVLPEVAAALVDLNDLNSPHTLAVLSVPPGSTVLDIGCGPGTVARALAARGCRVWGIELDPRRASSARTHCVEVLEADVETASLSAAFAGMTFDAVLFLDVLEHLREPQAALAKVAAVLAPGGSVLLSIPNVTHGALRLELLSGKFRYRASGLLDRGHLRFFDADAIDELVRQAGLRTESRLRVIRRLDRTEFDIDLASIPSTLRSAVEGDADALTYQFFVIATPARGLHAPHAGMTLLERQRARIDELAAALEKGGEYARHLQAELAAKDARLLEVEATVANTERARSEELAAVVETNGAHAAHLGEALAATTARVHDVESAFARAEQELAAKTARLTDVERAFGDLERDVETKATRLREVDTAVERLERALEAREARLRETEQLLIDRTRIFEDNEAYVRHLEGELRKRAGDVAIRDDAVGVLRAHIEQAERTISERDRQLAGRDSQLADRDRERVERDGELADRDAMLVTLRDRIEHADRAIADREVLLQIVERRAAERSEIAEQLSTLLRQPRHCLAENANTHFKRWMPALHRLLRPLAVSGARDSQTSPGSPPPRGTA